MKTSGIILMALSWITILSLAVFCFSRILSSNKKEDKE